MWEREREREREEEEVEEKKKCKKNLRLKLGKKTATFWEFNGSLVDRNGRKGHIKPVKSLGP